MTSFNNGNGNVMTFKVCRTDKLAALNINVLTGDGKSLAVSLGRDEISHLLLVLRGMEETVKDGRGVNVVGGFVAFTHVIEPEPGYIMTVKTSDGLANFIFKYEDAQAFSLLLYLESAFRLVCFDRDELGK